MTNQEFKQYMHSLHLNPADAAQLLGVSRRTVQRWLESEEIPGPVDQVVRAWQRLADHGVPWKPDRISVVLDDQEQIAFQREHDIELAAVLGRVEVRGGPSTVWEVDANRRIASCGSMEISFHRLQNGSFSLAYYSRGDLSPDVDRDSQLIEDATWHIAHELNRELEHGPVLLMWYDRPLKGSFDAKSSQQQFDTNAKAVEFACDRMGSSNFFEPWIVDAGARPTISGPLWTKEQLEVERRRRMNTDFRVKPMRNGELGLVHQSARAQTAHGVPADHSLAYRTIDELNSAVAEVEEKGFTVIGKEYLMFPAVGSSDGTTVLDLADHYDHDVFMTQFPLVKRFIYHLTYHRALAAELNRRSLKSEFWTLTIDAHLLQASILWCMVFGSPRSSPIHWKKLSPNQTARLESSFRESVCRETGLTWLGWTSYWQHMTEFRNKFAAHREIDYSRVLPNFETALKVAFLYDEWIRRVIKPDYLGEGSLKLFARNLAKSAVVQAESLLATTVESTT